MISSHRIPPIAIYIYIYIYIYLYIYRGHSASTSFWKGEGVDEESTKKT